VARFLALGYVPDPFTIYSSVFKLEPASTLIWSPHRPIEIARYWAPPLEADPNIDEQTAVEEIRRLLTESVRYRLIADVAIGAFLSGGVDSSAVVAMMSSHRPTPSMSRKTVAMCETKGFSIP
jgi:asparagine synthase (glutamine-hydrolysing)